MRACYICLKTHNPLHCVGNEMIVYVADIIAVLTHCAQQHEGLCCS